jgi:predicted nuclease of restriction endonuclease-like RecB superfamily
MMAAWRNQKHKPEQIKRSAKLGAQGLWRKYHADPAFKERLDNKLRESRSRGGTKSLWNLGEAGFKRRLEKGHISVRARFRDSLGHRLRSSLEVSIAELLIKSKVEFMVEPRVEVGGHAFYPDFSLNRGQKLIEVVGYAGDRYWNRTAYKIQLITEAHTSLQTAVVTTYLRIVTKRLRHIPRVTIFSPYQEAEIVRWCRGNAGVHYARKQSGLMRGP